MVKFLSQYCKDSVFFAVHAEQRESHNHHTAKRQLVEGRRGNLTSNLSLSTRGKKGKRKIKRKIRELLKRTSRLGEVAHAFNPLGRQR